MCYSPEADVVAGLIVGTVGIDAMRHVDDRRYLPLAAVPVVLAVHQFVEAVAWWGLRGEVPVEARDVAISVYLMIALGIVPVLVPFAALWCEPNARTRRFMKPFIALGLCVGVVLVTSLAAAPYGAAIGGRFIAYHVAAPAGGVLAVCYAIAVCVPLMASSRSRLRLLGWLNVPAFALLSLLLAQGLISLWCIWAAVTSIVVAGEIRAAASSAGECVAPRHDRATMLGHGATSGRASEVDGVRSRPDA